MWFDREFKKQLTTKTELFKEALLTSKYSLKITEPQQNRIQFFSVITVKLMGLEDHTFKTDRKSESKNKIFNVDSTQQKIIYQTR